MVLKAGGPMNLVRNFPSTQGHLYFAVILAPILTLTSFPLRVQAQYPVTPNIRFYTRGSNSATWTLMQKNFLQNWRGIISLAVNMEDYNNCKR